MYDLKLLDTFNQEHHLGSIHEEFGSYRSEEYESMKIRIKGFERVNRELAKAIVELNEKRYSHGSLHRFS